MLEEEVTILKTKKDYIEAIKAFKDQAVIMRIQLVDLASSYDCLVNKIQKLESERYEKFDKKTAEKVKKAVKKKGNKSKTVSGGVETVSVQR